MAKYAGANVADFGDEFGPQASISTGRGADNSEEAANKARHKNFDFSKSTVSSVGSVGYGESVNPDDIKQMDDVKDDGYKRASGIYGTQY